MELWIRSQDGDYLMPIKDTISSFRTGVFYQGVILGTYKSKQRTLEVLDEIQNILQPRVYIKAPSIVNPKDMIEDLANSICLRTTQQVEMELKQVGQFVYQMPKE